MRRGPRCEAPSQNNAGRRCPSPVMPGTKRCWNHSGQDRKLVLYLPPALLDLLRRLVQTGLYGETVDEALLHVAKERLIQLSGPLLTPRRR